MNQPSHTDRPIKRSIGLVFFLLELIPFLPYVPVPFRENFFLVPSCAAVFWILAGSWMFGIVFLEEMAAAAAAAAAERFHHCPSAHSRFRPTAPETSAVPVSPSLARGHPLPCPLPDTTLDR